MGENVKRITKLKIMKKKEFLQLVMNEILALKENATQKEKDKLDIQRLNPWSARSCIYGLMTGSADSSRANSLQQKMFNGYTALEVYITLKGTNLGNVVSYIKGEIDSIKL